MLLPLGNPRYDHEPIIESADEVSFISSARFHCNSCLGIIVC